jgi:hypothetical protein
MLAGRFWGSYIGQRVGGEWDMTHLIGGTVERAAIQLVTSTWLRKDRPDDGGSKHLWNVGQLLRDYIPEDNHIHTLRRENLKSQHFYCKPQ